MGRTLQNERERYLQRAQEARALAATSDPALRADFLKIAENWEMLARHCEERKAPETSDKGSKDS